MVYLNRQIFLEVAYLTSVVLTYAGLNFGGRYRIAATAALKKALSGATRILACCIHGVKEIVVDLLVL